MVPSLDPHSLLARIGNTPLIRLRRLVADWPGVEVYCKAEWMNPGGSVKDRPALNMVLEALRRGDLKPGQTILDATSGNTGIALAMIGAVLGYRVCLCIPANASVERFKILQAYGAEVIRTDPLEGSDGAIRMADRLMREAPDLYYRVDQYGNPDNWRAHYKTTAEEIWRQTDGRITHFIAGLGTSGTLVGTGRRLKELRADIQVIAVEPEPFHGIEGLKNMATAIVPPIYDPSVHDLKVEVRTEEAYYWTRRLAREEGLFVGQSSGAVMAALMKLRPRIREGVVVLIFADGGDKYLSTPTWSEP